MAKIQGRDAVHTAFLASSRDGDAISTPAEWCHFIGQLKAAGVCSTSREVKMGLDGLPRGELPAVFGTDSCAARPGVSMEGGAALEDPVRIGAEGVENGPVAVFHVCLFGDVPSERVLCVPAGEYWFGRSKDCYCTVGYSLDVSMYHARFRVTDDGQVYVTDRSMFGTEVDEWPIEKDCETELHGVARVFMQAFGVIVYHFAATLPTEAIPPPVTAPPPASNVGAAKRKRTLRGSPSLDPPTTPPRPRAASRPPRTPSRAVGPPPSLRGHNTPGSKEQPLLRPRVSKPTSFYQAMSATDSQRNHRNKKNKRDRSPSPQPDVKPHVKCTTFHKPSDHGSWIDFWCKKTREALPEFCPCARDGEPRRHELDEHRAGAHVNCNCADGTIRIGIVPTCRGCNTKERPIVFPCTAVSVFDRGAATYSGKLVSASGDSDEKDDEGQRQLRNKNSRRTFGTITQFAWRAEGHDETRKHLKVEGFDKDGKPLEALYNDEQEYLHELVMVMKKRSEGHLRGDRRNHVPMIIRLNQDGPRTGSQGKPVCLGF
jgi:hypothetical protein